jgi:DNA invertase Pin-like site-specific DNA recombinase
MATPMIYGYVRVSTSEQTSRLQWSALTEAGCERDRIYSDICSGIIAPRERAGFATLLGQVMPGDKIAVWKLDRLSRSLGNLITTLGAIEARGAEVVSLTETMETKTPGGVFVRNIFGAVAEFERELIRARVIEGMARARSAGVHLGRRASLNPDQVRQLRAMRADGVGWAVLGRTFRVSYHTARDAAEGVGAYVGVK